MKFIGNRGLIFALCAFFCPLGATQDRFDASIEVTPTEVIVDIRSSDIGVHTCRVEASADMQTWDTVLDLGETVSNQLRVVVPGEMIGDALFFRVVMDEEISDVLDLPSVAYNYADIELPAHLRIRPVRDEDNTPADNPVCDAGATLGRVLFYDKKLSLNYSVSCSSCHQQENGFSDPDAFSTGFEGGLTGRNSMGLSNAKFYERGHFFWDERADTLEDQVLGPIQNEVEMGMDLDVLKTRLQEYGYYRELFVSAFGDNEVTSERISLALSQFLRSMLSYRSKYDEGEASGFSNYNAEELLGREIFNGPRGDCSRCHGGPNFVGNRIDNNGLEFLFTDLGVEGVTGRVADEGKFKMSSLRNIEKTAPYMHDGRFATLEDVIDHYSTGVVSNPSLGPQLTVRGPSQVALRRNFTDAEKLALVAFLKTLTDEAFLTDPKYGDPFLNR